MTKLYFTDVSPLFSDDDLYYKAYHFATEKRRKKTDLFQLREDRARCIGAELLLRYALKNEGIFSCEIELRCNQKPYLSDNRCYFNLSHSGNYVICAVSDSEVGCDIEKQVPISKKIAEKFFTPSEVETIVAGKTPEERNTIFYRFWTMKESFVKALGLGLKLPLNAFQIDLADSIKLIQSVDPRDFRLEEFAGIDGYCCAVCTENLSNKTIFSQIELLEIMK